jgi:alpha-mannosidase
MAQTTRREQEYLQNAAKHKGLVERFQAQAKFARRLAKLEGDAASGWEALITQAEVAFGDYLSGAKLEGNAHALKQAEAILSPIGAAAKQHTLHCVGHGHIDMNWMWSWQETVSVTNDTFLTVLKLMDEFPGFTYSQSQGAVYDIARVFNPELFERVKQKVKEGRWEVSASHWVEGDKNLASGESLTRHLLYTRRYIKEHLGLDPQDVPIDWEPDTFGHAWTIPSIDARGGVSRYYLCRPGNEERPPVFWWQGPDGKRVLVNREQAWYNSDITPESADLLLNFREKTGLKDWMQVYGVGDHGGGPTRRDLRRIVEMNEWPIFPNIRFALSGEFYDILEANGDKWPVLDKELNYEFAGCYTSQSAIKKNNRQGENAAAEADTAATLAFRALGRAYPAEMLHQAWIDVLFSHFHDILPGSGVPDTRTFNQGTFQRIMAATGMIKTHSLRAIAAAVDTSFAGTVSGHETATEYEAQGMGGGAGRSSQWGTISDAGHVVDGPRPVVVFNPTAWPRSEVVKMTVWDAQTGVAPGPLKEKKFVVRDADGKAIPAQRLSAGGYWGHEYVDLAFPVSVGPLGYTAYSVEEGEVEGHEPATRANVAMEGGWGVNLRDGAFSIENEFLKVAFDRSNAGIISFLDKRTGREFADPEKPMGMLEYVMERPQGGSAWIFGDTMHTEYPLQVEAFGAKAEDGWQMDVKSSSPHVATAAAKVRVGGSTFTVTFQLKTGQPWLEVSVAGRWLERGSKETGVPQLAIRFPIGLTGATARYEIPFGSITRDEVGGREVPGLRWADVTGRLDAGGEAAGLAVLNDSKYGHSLHGSTMRLTLIRATYEPDPLPEIGDHVIHMALAPHDADAPVADLTRLGAGFNHPLQPVNTDAHQGALPARLDAAVTCSAPNVLVSQIKKAEDDDSVIFRLYETGGRDATATVTLDAALLGAPKSAVEVDFLERAASPNSAAATANGFTVKVPAHAIASVKVGF